MDYQEYQRSSHLSRADAQTRSSPTRQTRHSTDHPIHCQNKPNNVHQNIHELYSILQKDMVSKAKSIGDDSWKLGRIICQAAKSFGSFAILCHRDGGHISNRIRVREKWYLAKKCLSVCFGHFVHVLMGLHIANS